MKATSFIFDGVPCEEYDLRIYYFDNNSTTSQSLFTNEIVEERLPSRYDPIVYGLNINQSRTYNITFGCLHYLSNYEVERIADWLTSHDTYKWLEICQDDLKDVRFKVIMQNLQMVEINGIPVAFTCDVITDSQFAYQYPQSQSFKIKNNKIVVSQTENSITYRDMINVNNESSYNGYIYPKMTITMDDDCETFSIINTSDNNNTFTLSKVPNNYSSIVDEYHGLQEKYETLTSTTIPNEKSALAQLKSFIDLYGTLKGTDAADPFTATEVANWLASTTVQINAKIAECQTAISASAYYAKFVPSTSTAMVVSGPLYYYVLDKMTSTDLVNTTTTGTTWLDNLYTDCLDENYIYDNYSLIPLYNYRYLIATASTDTAKVASWKNMAYIHLLLAILDYKSNTDKMNQHELDSQTVLAAIDAYDLSGKMDIMGDELVVEVDNKNQVMTCNRDGVNIYEYFGDENGRHNFLRLLRGDNNLQFEGSGTVEIQCEFLRKVGI